MKYFSVFTCIFCIVFFINLATLNGTLLVIILWPTALVLGLILGSLIGGWLNKILSKKTKFFLLISYIPAAFLPLLHHAYIIYTFPLPPNAYNIKRNLLPQSGSLSTAAITFTDKKDKSDTIATFYNTELTKNGWKKCGSVGDENGYKIKFLKGLESSTIYITGESPNVYPHFEESVLIDPWGSCKEDSGAI